MAKRSKEPSAAKKTEAVNEVDTPYQIIEGDVLESLALVADQSCALVVSSPPYNIGKSYEIDDRRSLDEYRDWQREVLTLVDSKVTPTGSICWQVGTHVQSGELFPLDYLFIELFHKLGYRLRNRVIWRYNFGYNADRRFSGRYETLLWLTKSHDYTFNLDPVRVPQLYPGKRHSASKGAKAGLLSGNPLGKNPSDVWEFSAELDFVRNPIWDLPNVKSNHPEKTEHPCQFPVELAERCILAMSNADDVVLDPFVGTGATLIAATLHGRRSVGIERDGRYVQIATERLSQLKDGSLQLRPSGAGIQQPDRTQKVAQVPAEWLASDDSGDREAS